jgi:hypothetical protein
MQKIILVTIFLANYFNTFSQSESEKYLFKKDIMNKLTTDSVSWKFQTAAVEYSFIGDYKGALNIWDQGLNPKSFTPTRKDSAILSAANIVSAKDYIINRAKAEQIIIINEAHHNSRHRVFTASLLEGLYQQGYRYLGLEAIWDTTINNRAYAIQSSGYYTAEPEFGNMIHTARRLGFIVFGYEAKGGENGKEREIAQANNIKAFLDQNTNEKCLIHCGYDHVMEGEVRGWEKAMAGRIKEYTGINPFTIDQVKFSEKSKADYSHYFVYGTQEEKPFVLKTRDSLLFNGLTDPKQTDVSVIHPISHYDKGRPKWMAEQRQEYLLSRVHLDKMNFPLQILAYRKGEYQNNGVPADIIEIETYDENKALYLEKGQYEIILRNDRYEVLKQFDININ